MPFKKSTIHRLLSLWPPFLGAGIRVRSISPDYRRIEVEMGLKFWNKNYVGTQFGGSLYAMTDPFFMLILMENLGSGFIVWDKESTIRFRRPGRGKVRAVFEVSQERIEEIRAQAEQLGKLEPEFNVSIVDEQGETIAEVRKLLHVRKKKS